MKRPSTHPTLDWGGLRRPAKGTSWVDLVDAWRVRLTYSGRAAIYQVLQNLGRRRSPGRQRTTVLVPAFHCPTVVDPVLHAGYAVRFYAVDRGLRVVESDLRNKLDESVAAAVFIRYFGFTDDLDALFRDVREVGARVIDDCSHSFLSSSPLRLASRNADFTTYSFWKLVPCITGGGILTSAGLESAPDAWPTESRGAGSTTNAAAVIRELFAPQLGFLSDAAAGLAGRKRPTVEPRSIVLKSAAEAYPYDRSAADWTMPIAARLVLSRANLKEVAESRRRNYASFGRTLVSCDDISPIRSGLGDDVVPWGFPVLLRKRSKRDYLIHAKGVPVFSFGEVLHPLLLEQHRHESAMMDSAIFLSRTLLVFAIHQCLSTPQVEGYANAVNEFVDTLKLSN